MTDAPSFREVANAISEVAYTESEIAQRELHAREFQRWGLSPVSVEMSLLRMRRRAECLEVAHRHFSAPAGTPIEPLIYELTQVDPPRWSVIWMLTKEVFRLRWSRRRVRSTDA